MDLHALFNGYNFRRIEEAKNNNIRFSHYTSAAVAVEILRKKQVWLRNAAAMNDFLEIKHGENCLKHVLERTDLGGRLSALINRLKPNTAHTFIEDFWRRNYERNNVTYVLSLSEHEGTHEASDMYGKLSMWRAYGGNTNVALTFSTDVFFSEVPNLNAFISPVFYCDEQMFANEFQLLIKNLEDNFQVLNSAGNEAVLNQLYWTLHFAVLSAKHLGFSEEREWRVIHNPSMWPSQVMTEEVEVFDGTPQRVFKVKLINDPQHAPANLSLSNLLEEIIIGPTKYPQQIADALIYEMNLAQIPKPRDKVRISEIPLRR